MKRPDLSDFLAPGVSPDEVPPLAPLLAAGGIIDSFVSLFRGSDAEVLMRLLVLREIGQEAEATHWSFDTLRRRFSYLDPVKFDTVLKRLREHGLLVSGEDARYHLSDLGRNAVAALAALLQFDTGEDAELGFLTTQLAGLSATDSLTPEALGHLLGKLNELSWLFEDAIASGSEFRILQARSRLQANGRWLERGTGILRSLLADPEVDFHIARVAQRIGLAQSRLARVDAAFQRALNKIEAQRVTLGASGISSSDVAAWLRRQAPGALAALLVDALDLSPNPSLLAGGHELLDRAESALEDPAGNAPDATLPPPEAATVSAAPEQEDLRLLQHFTARLEALAAPASLAETVTGGGFGDASYRLSLLAQLADGAGAGIEAGPVGDFLALPLAVEFDDALEAVHRDGIAAITRGRIHRRSAAPSPEES